MKILITGINGLLGKDLGKYLGFNKEYEIHGIGRADCHVPNVTYKKLDMLDFDVLKKYLQKNQFDVIVHCAAMTKIDICEDDHELALKSNVEVSRCLAEYGSRMIYISSDSVFDGKTGNYSEAAPICPVSFYGRTKWLGEEAVRTHNKNSVILRTSMYGYNYNGNISVPQWAALNIKNHIPMKGFNDVITNPMYTSQIADLINVLLHNNFIGTLNIGCIENVSRYGLFCRMAKYMKIEPEFIESVSVDSMSFKATRTKNTVLNVDKLRNELGVEFSIEDGLQRFYYDYLKWI